MNRRPGSYSSKWRLAFRKAPGRPRTRLVLALLDEGEKLRSEVNQQEEELSGELARVKEIDMQRRSRRLTP